MSLSKGGPVTVGIPFVWLLSNRLLHGLVIFFDRFQAGPDGWMAFHPAPTVFLSHHMTGAAVRQAAWDDGLFSVGCLQRYACGPYVQPASVTDA